MLWRRFVRTYWRGTRSLYLMDSKARALLLLPGNTSGISELLPLKLRRIISSSSSAEAALREVRRAHARLIRAETAPVTYLYNVLIRAYTDLHAPSYALHLYLSIPRSFLLPDFYTLPITLKALSLSPSRGAAHLLLLLAQLHSVAIRLSLHAHAHCESAFVALYAKLGQLHHARQLLDENPHPLLPSWNALIAALSRAALPRQALEVFLGMRRRGFLPDDITMVAVNGACGSLGDLRLAHQLHKLAFQAARNVDRPNHILLMMHNSVIDMYGKCACMDEAARVFSSMPLKNVSSWTSMIVCYALHGHADLAISFFHRMVAQALLAPNHVTFVGLLTACVHAGRVHEGKHYFDIMRRVYGIMPRLQHYGCLVDLLGRAGLLQEAREVIEGMPMEPNAIIFGCLMGACEQHGDVEMAEWVAEHLRALEPWNDGVYVVLSNIYATRGLWDEVERVRVIMKHHNFGKSPAYSALN